VPSALRLKSHANAELIGPLGRGERQVAVETNRYQGQHGKCAEDLRNRPPLLHLQLIWDLGIEVGDHTVGLLLRIHSADLDAHGPEPEPHVTARPRHAAPVIWTPFWAPGMAQTAWWGLCRTAAGTHEVRRSPAKGSTVPHLDRGWRGSQPAPLRSDQGYFRPAGLGTQFEALPDSKTGAILDRERPSSLRSNTCSPTTPAF
jgi:hypothetical protein